VKLDINSQVLQACIVTRCELMKKMSSNEGAGNANPKLPVKLM